MSMSNNLLGTTADTRFYVNNEYITVTYTLNDSYQAHYYKIKLENMVI